MKIAEVACPVPVHKAFHYQVLAGQAVSPGVRVRVPFGPRSLVGTVLSVFEGTPERKLKDILSVVDRDPYLPAELLGCAVWMSRRYGAAIGECMKAVLPPYVRELSRPKPRVEPAKTGRPARRAVTLTPGQESALSALEARLSAKRHAAALLYGVPASGKTEVYLRLIRKAIAGGGQALFLLPEISLTVPFFDEFAEALDVPVVLWHSQLGQAERREAWKDVRSGRVKVVVGARSASLLPFVDLRLVVLDEEQDESFKQEGQAPLYHARDLALHRAQAHGALAVLGSATPSMESWNLARAGKLELVSMPERVFSTERPAVRIIEAPMGRCLSFELVAAIKERLARREQVILLVNRRGFSTLLLCAKCGWIDRCEDCGVAKIQHEDAAPAPGTAPDQLALGLPRAGSGFVQLCHHCGRRTPVPQTCAKCKNPALRLSGIGTQKVVAELRSALRGARVLRMDRDTVSKEGKEERRLYQRFLDHEADILVGTKLVAKSFHFPEVTLVGVVDADTMIHMPDFRSAERTMQMLAQVAGRSGRAEKKGEVIIQTLSPDHYAIRKAAAGDYSGFAEAELSFRGELRYPPFSCLVRLVWTGKGEETVAAAASASADHLRARLEPQACELLGPAPAIPPVAAGKHRYHLLVKVPEDARLEAACAEARAAPLPSTVRLKINVDPYDLF